MKRWFIAEDSEYFKSGQDIIKLENCPQGGNACKTEMAYMNRALYTARKYSEDKEYTKCFHQFQEAFSYTLDIKEKQCQKCAELFRTTIFNSLNHVMQDLERLSKGWFAKKRYKNELLTLQDLIKDFEMRINNPPKAETTE